MINFGQEKNIIPKCLITSVDKLKDNFNMIKFENIKAFDKFCMRKCATDINMTKLLANIDIDLKKELVYNLVLVGSHSIKKYARTYNEVHYSMFKFRGVKTKNALSYTFIREKT